MRLINVQTLDLEDFEDDITTNLKYGILSHRWVEGEVTYQDVVSIGLINVQKKGIAKIRKVCELALVSDLHYVWVDTCCIDKTSSAELSEAINSMFRWYQQAQTCFAYLSDIGVGSAPELSLWFSRAWTLQELIAPQEVLFYSTEWQILGSKADLADGISARTGISHGILKNEVNIYSLPIAQRMSWARQRRARRVEDIAYSLLGIFDVNMPLLYGEGSKAFRRLQEEIIKQSNDQTIFIWTSKLQDVGKLLAPSPDAFDQNKIFRFRPSQKGKRPFSVTNLGLSITLPLIPWHSKTYLALLDCEVTGTVPETTDDWRQWHQPGLYLRRSRDSDILEKVNFLSRDYGFLLGGDPSRLKIKDIHIAMNPVATASYTSRQLNWDSNTYDSNRGDGELYGFVLRSIETHDGKIVSDIIPQCTISTTHTWDQEHRILDMRPGTAGDAVIISLPRNQFIPQAVQAVKLGFDFDFQPCCIIGVARTDLMPNNHQSTHSLRTESSEAILKAVDLSQEHDWQDLAGSYHIPLSSQGYWLLKGDPHLGLSVALGPPAVVGQNARDYCFAQRQIRVRLTRESYRGKIAWMFDLHISPCFARACESHKEEDGQAIAVPPEIIISPPGLSPWAL